MACRVQKRREWTLRNLHELQDYKDKSLFVTLTYKSICQVCTAKENGFPPVLPSLRKRDLQLFLKRIRKAISPTKIRYYACGEYGDKTKRLHYHLIIYGMGWEHRQTIMDNWTYTDWTVEDIQKGSFGFVEPDSIRYVAQYIDSKLTGEDAMWQYTVMNREPVFKLQSQGIGKKWALENQDKVISDMFCSDHKGHKQSIPRYYLKKYDLDQKTARKFRQEQIKNNKISQGETLAKYTNLHATEDGFYKSNVKNDIKIKYYNEKNKALEQHSKNLVAKNNLLNKKF